MQSEDELCRAFIKELDALLLYNQINNPESFKIWHNDNGQRAGSDLSRKIAGKRAKLMGGLKGLPDYTLLWRDAKFTPFTGFLEAKTKEGEATKEQEDFIRYCHRENIPIAIFRTVPQAFRIMQEWGIIKETAIL